MTTTFIKWHYNGILKLYQKEKEKNKKYQGIENGTTIIYKSKAKYVREDRIEKYYINKNKIREKIKEAQNKVEELKNADLTTVYMNGFYNGEKKWKDKIKNKIKEINETYEELEEDELGRKEYYYPNYTIDILEELLGE